MQKLMERLDRQDELLLAMKAEGKQPAITGKHPPFRQSGLVYAAPDKLSAPATLPQRRHINLGHFGENPIASSEEDVLTFLFATISRTVKVKI